MGAFTMDSHKLLLVVMILGLCQIAKAQSPTYGVGRTPTAEEIRAWDIVIGPEGKELPPGHGTAVEGAKLFIVTCGFIHYAHPPTFVGLLVQVVHLVFKVNLNAVFFFKVIKQVAGKGPEVYISAYGHIGSCYFLLWAAAFHYQRYPLV